MYSWNATIHDYFCNLILNAGCNKGFVINKHCYFVINKATNFNEALEACTAADAYLAPIESEKTYKILELNLIKELNKTTRTTGSWWTALMLNKKVNIFYWTLFYNLCIQVHFVWFCYKYTKLNMAFIFNLMKIILKHQPFVDNF